MGRNKIVLLLAVPLLLTMAACGGGDDDTASADPTSESTEDQAVEFAQCMREQGIDVPDPDPDTGRVPLPNDGSIDVDSDEFAAAFEACQDLAPFGNPDAGQDLAKDPAVQEALLEFAQCMRDNGVDMPDPAAGEIFGALRGQADDPDFRDAFEACQPILRDVFGEDGPGGRASG